MRPRRRDDSRRVGRSCGPIIINKPLTLIGEPAQRSAAKESGKVVTVAADDVTLRGLRITGSGLQLSDDDAAIFVTGNHARIENCVIADSLHGIYLKKVSGAQILNNRIQGKTTLAASSEPVEKGIGTSTENCDTTLVSNRRGNGIHQWNCEGNLIRGNEISDTRDGIYFSFTNNSRVENNLVHHVRYGLHYMYSDGNVFENNTFTENAAGAAIMFSKELVVRGNRFINNRGHRAYGLIFQSSDRSRLEENEITAERRRVSRLISATKTRLPAIASRKITSGCVSARIPTAIGSRKMFSCAICIRSKPAPLMFPAIAGP